MTPFDLPEDLNGLLKRIELVTVLTKVYAQITRSLHASLLEEGMSDEQAMAVVLSLQNSLANQIPGIAQVAVDYERSREK